MSIPDMASRGYGTTGLAVVTEMYRRAASGGLTIQNIASGRFLVAVPNKEGRTLTQSAQDIVQIFESIRSSGWQTEVSMHCSELIERGVTTRSASVHINLSPVLPEELFTRYDGPNF